MRVNTPTMLSTATLHPIVEGVIEAAVMELERGARHYRDGIYLSGSKGMEVATGLFEIGVALSTVCADDLAGEVEGHIRVTLDNETREAMDGYTHSAEVYAIIAEALGGILRRG